MALTANLLRKQVDLPVWEWLRQSPFAPGSTGTSCACSGDPSQLNEISGRYIYYLATSTTFYRYDTISDSYQQLAGLPFTVATASSMRFIGSQGYYNRVISASSTTLVTGLPYGNSPVGYRIRIIAGKGAGQERVITAVSDPVVADSGYFSAGTTTSGTDSTKSWAVNNWLGYMVRVITSAGPATARKILKNSSTVLTIGDTSFTSGDFQASTTWTSPNGGLYNIESSTITVDTAWDTTPDNTSRFVILSGAVWLLSYQATANFALCYYDILHDVWYARTANSNMMGGLVATDISLERFSDNQTLWYTGTASTGSSTTLLKDTTANWTTNQWAGYQVYIYTGTGRGQIATVTSNTATELSFSALNTAPDTTSRYQILGYEGGVSSGSNTYNTFNDSTHSWTVNRWANYGIRILSGTGAGQSRQIQSNTATGLTIYGSWNILPDNTSVYVIQGHTDCMYITYGGSASIFTYNAGLVDLITQGRMTDSGMACVACALLSDSSHNIYEYNPIAISSISGTTTITATTSQTHNLKVGQYISIRGITSAAADQYNVTGLYQIATVPSTTTFTYTPAATGSGTYAYLTALSTTNISDASKDFRDSVSTSTNTSITFTRTTPSNINGWYVTGTNITQGAKVSSGAGTTTVNLSTGTAAASGVIIFSAIGPTSVVTGTYASGGGAGQATITLSGNTPSTINGWLVSGTNIPVGTTVTSGAGGTALVLSKAATGTPSGTISFYPPEFANKVIIVGVSTITAGTGAVTGSNQYVSAVGAGTGSTITMAGATTSQGTASAQVSRYAITNLAAIGAGYDVADATGSPTNLFGVATGGSGVSGTLIDSTTYWATATGSGTGGTTTITLNITSPGGINGWYISGTGIAAGTQIVSGAGTTTLTVNLPLTGSVSGIMTCTAWSNALLGRRIKLITGATSLNQESATITGSITSSSGTISIGNAYTTDPTAGTTVYSILSKPLSGAGHEITLAYGNSNAATRGKYLWMPRGGSSAGIDKLDITTDKVNIVFITPFSETLTTGSFYAYDGADRIYIHKEVTLRVYFLDINTQTIHPAGLIPYTAGTASVGNKMEIFTTVDGLKYLWVNRSQNVEHFRQLIFY